MLPVGTLSVKQCIVANQRKSSAVRRTTDSKPGTRDYDGSYYEHPEGSCLAYRKLSWS